VGKVKPWQGNMESLEKMKEIAYDVLPIPRNDDKWFVETQGLHIFNPLEPSGYYMYHQP
jgi:hypothetical protein